MIDLGKYIGIPYVHKGRSMAGLDCWGLIKFVYSDLGFNVFDPENYGSEIEIDESYFVDQSDEWERTAITIAFDVVLILNKKGVACHAGMITPDRKFIHCTKNTGVAILNLDHVKNILNIDGYYRLKARNDKDKV